MAATQLGIVYSTRQRTIRRIVAPDSDSQLSTSIAGPGESLYIIPLTTSTLDAARGLLANAVGAAANDLCAICSGQDRVVGVVRADPQILNDTKGLPNGYYMVDAIPAKVQTGTFVDALGVTQPINQAITAGWFYNPLTGNFGLTKNP